MSLTWILGNILCPVIIFLIFRHPVLMDPSALTSPATPAAGTHDPKLDVPVAMSFKAPWASPGPNNSLFKDSNLSDYQSGGVGDGGGDVADGTVVGAVDDSGVDTAVNGSSNTYPDWRDGFSLKKIQNIVYIYGFVGIMEMSAGGTFAVLWILLKPSILRKDSVCVAGNKLAATFVGQPKCFGFGFVVLIIIFSCLFINTEFFPRYLLSSIAVHNNKLTVAYAALMVSCFEVGIVIGRIMSLVSSCILSARVLLNIGGFMACLSFLLLLCALQLGDLVMYASAVVIGASVSNVYTHLFQWACNYMVISSFVRWSYVLGCVLGCVIGLPVAGFLVKAMGYGVIAYLLLGASLCSVVLLVVLQVYAAAARPVMMINDPADEELRTFARSS